MWNKELLTPFHLPNLNCKEFDDLRKKIAYENLNHYTKDYFYLTITIHILDD